MTNSHILITYAAAVGAHKVGEVFNEQKHNHGAIHGAMLDVFKAGFDTIAGVARKADRDFRDEDNRRFNVKLEADVDGRAFPSVEMSDVSYRTAHEVLKAVSHFGAELTLHGDKRAQHHHDWKTNEPAKDAKPTK